MRDCLSAIMDGSELSANASQELDEAGFTVIPGDQSQAFLLVGDNYYSLFLKREEP